MARKKIEIPLENTQKEISQKTEKTSPKKGAKKKKTQKEKPIKKPIEKNTKKTSKATMEKTEEITKEKPVKKPTVKKERPLNMREKAFCREYVKSGNTLDSVRKAGYSTSSDNVGSAIASRLLRRDAVQTEIARLLQRKEDKAIATAEDVMKFFTRCMNGEEKDQFGLDISAADKIKAAMELAKRTIDIENRIKGTPDNVVNIKVDWRKS